MGLSRPRQADALDYVTSLAQAYFLLADVPRPSPAHAGLSLQASSHTFASVPTTRSLSSTILSLIEER